MSFKFSMKNLSLHEKCRIFIENSNGKSKHFNRMTTLTFSHFLDRHVTLRRTNIFCSHSCPGQKQSLNFQLILCPLIPSMCRSKVHKQNLNWEDFLNFHFDFSAVIIVTNELITKTVKLCYFVSMIELQD